MDRTGGVGGEQGNHRIYGCSGEAMEGRGKGRGGGARRLQREPRFFLWTSHFTPMDFSSPVDKVGYQASLPTELSQDAMGSWYTYLPSPLQKSQRASTEAAIIICSNTARAAMSLLSSHTTKLFLTERHLPASAFHVGRVSVMHVSVFTSQLCS